MVSTHFAFQFHTNSPFTSVIFGSLGPYLIAHWLVPMFLGNNLPSFNRGAWPIALLVTKWCTRIPWTWCNRHHYRKQTSLQDSHQYLATNKNLKVFFCNKKSYNTDEMIFGLDDAASWYANILNIVTLKQKNTRIKNKRLIQGLKHLTNENAPWCAHFLLELGMN